MGCTSFSAVDGARSDVTGGGARLRIPGALLLALLVPAASGAPRSVGLETQEPAVPASQEPGDAADPLAERAGAVCAQVLERPEVDEAMFHPAFLDAVPRLRLRAILREYHKQAGAVREVVPLGRDGRFSGRFLALGEGGSEFVVTLGVEPTPPHRVTTLFFAVPAPSVTTWEAWAEQLGALPGATGFAVCQLPAEGDGELRVLHAKAPDAPLAIGSAFKLWVLGALAEEVAAGERAWDDVTRLEPAGVSLPSGELQEWPAGAPLTLHTLAALMIAKSDNTATDHLIRLLGRERVERAMRAMGSANPGRNEPFLTTRELFLLKGAGGGAHAEAYLALEGADARRAYLDGTLAQLGLDGFDPLALVAPNRIDSLEWFASPLDLCRAMDSLRRRIEAGDALLGGLLSINAGVPLGGDLFAYLGYKGGSEPGVLDLTWLVRRRDGAWWALSVTWNDAATALKEERLIGLGTKGLLLLALGERDAAPDAAPDAEPGEESGEER